MPVCGVLADLPRDEQRPAGQPRDEVRDVPVELSSLANVGSRRNARRLAATLGKCGTSCLVNAVRRQPSELWSVSAVPTAWGRTLSVTSTERWALSAMTKTPHVSATGLGVLRHHCDALRHGSEHVTGRGRTRGRSAVFAAASFRGSRRRWLAVQRLAFSLLRPHRKSEHPMRRSGGPSTRSGAGKTRVEVS